MSSMPGYDPVGVSRLYQLDTAPVSLTAPKVSEIEAGTELSDWLVPDGIGGGTKKAAYIDDSSLSDDTQSQAISQSTIDNLELTGKAPKHVADPAQDVVDGFTVGDTYWYVFVPAGAPVATQKCSVIVGTAGPLQFQNRQGKKLATVMVPHGTSQVLDNVTIAAS